MKETVSGRGCFFLNTVYVICCYTSGCIGRQVA